MRFKLQDEPGSFHEFQNEIHRKTLEKVSRKPKSISQELISYAFNKVVAVSGAKCWHDVNHSMGGLQKPPHWPLTPT